MPLLRRPDDHHRNLRRRAPCAPAIAEPDQDRHLMTIMARSWLPRSARLRRRRLSRRGRVGPQPVRDPVHAPTARYNQRRALRRTSSSSRRPVVRSRPRRSKHRPALLDRRLQIPIAGSAANAALPARGFLLGRLSNAGPALRPHRSCWGRRPKPFIEGVFQAFLAMAGATSSADFPGFGDAYS